MPYQMTFEGKRVFLIDTPGFNDSSACDVDILNDLAGWLAKAYKDSVHMNGLIYLHGIQDSRMTGSDRMHLNVFKQLTGLENMSHVVLATSFWDVIKNPAIGERRENELLTKKEFWKAMKDAGAEVMRFNNDLATAMEMVKHIINKNEKTVLEIQKEMETDKKSVIKTKAGQTLVENIDDKVKDVEKKITQHSAELVQALKEENQQKAKEALDAQDKLNAQIVEWDQTKNKLDVTTKELLQQKDAQIKKATQEAEKLILEREKAEEEHERQLSAKDKEADAKVEQTNREWQDGFLMLREKFEGFAEGINASSLVERASLEGQRPALTEERLKELFAQYNNENKIRDLEARLANAQSPPPYSSTAGSSSQQQLPLEGPQQQVVDVATLGGATAAGAAIATAALCCVM